MEFKMKISSILHFSWSILVKCCVHLRTSPSKTQTLPQEKNIIYSIQQILTVLICYRFVVIIYELCSLLSFVCHS